MREAGQSGGGRRGPEVGPRLDAAERAALGQVGERLVPAEHRRAREHHAVAVAAHRRDPGGGRLGHAQSAPTVNQRALQGVVGVPLLLD